MIIKLEMLTAGACLGAAPLAAASGDWIWCAFFLGLGAIGAKHSWAYLEEAA